MFPAVQFDSAATEIRDRSWITDRLKHRSSPPIVEMTAENIEEEKYLKQIGKAVNYYSQTLPNFATCFTKSISDGESGNGAEGKEADEKNFDAEVMEDDNEKDDGKVEVKIGFIEGRWKNSFEVTRHHWGSTNFGNGYWNGDKLMSHQIADARKLMQEQVRQAKETIQSKSHLVSTDEGSAERNRFFWILVELVLLYDTNLENGVMGDIKSPTFLSLDFEDGYWMRDVKKMLTHLNTVNWSQLATRILHSFGSIHLLRKFKLKDENDESAGDVWLDGYRVIMEAEEAVQLIARLKTMFLYTPCKSLIDALGKKLPWTFFIEYADCAKWRAEADRVFAFQLRQTTNLITPLAMNVLGYLWDPISEETKALEEKVRQELNIKIGRKLDFGTHIDFPVLYNIQYGIQADFDLGPLRYGLGYGQEDAVGFNQAIIPQSLIRIDRLWMDIDIDGTFSNGIQAIQFIEPIVTQNSEDRVEYEQQRQHHKSILRAVRCTQRQQQKRQQSRIRQPRNLPTRKYNHSRNLAFGGR